MMGQAAVKSMSEVGRLTPNRQHCRCSRCCCCWSCCSSPDCPWQPRLLVAVDRPDDGVSATFTCLAFAPCSFPKQKQNNGKNTIHRSLQDYFANAVKIDSCLSLSLPISQSTSALYHSFFLYIQNTHSRALTQTRMQCRALIHAMHETE